MIKGGEDLDLFSDPRDLIPRQLGLVEKLDGHLQAWVRYVVAQKNLAEDSRPQDLTRRGYKVVLLKFLPSILGVNDGCRKNLSIGGTLLFQHTGSH